MAISETRPEPVLSFLRVKPPLGQRAVPESLDPGFSVVWIVAAWVGRLLTGSAGSGVLRTDLMPKLALSGSYAAVPRRGFLTREQTLLETDIRCGFV